MKQENIRVGCVPHTSVATTGCQHGNCTFQGLYIPGLLTHTQKDPGTRHTQPPKRTWNHFRKRHGTRHIQKPVNRHTIVKTLPSRNFEEFTWKNSPAQGCILIYVQHDYNNMTICLLSL